MPSCAILYCSTTGNTKLACEYIVRKLPSIEFMLFDMRNLSGFQPDAFTFVGFATYVDVWTVPKVFVDTLAHLTPPSGKEAFILLTWGVFQGNGLNDMKAVVENRGFKVMIGHSLRTPENYPPMRKLGFKKDDSPKAKDVDAFRRFISELGEMIVEKEQRGSVQPRKIVVGPINRMFKKKVRTDSHRSMGLKIHNKQLCKKCGTCFRSCAYGAIRMEDGPVFDEGKCHGCFSCSNNCPEKAITAEKLRSADYQFRGPSETMLTRFKE